MRVSLLLPVASAAFAAASFIVIPDEQTIKLVASNRHHQAPITSDDKQKVVEPEKPRHDGGTPHEHHGHRCDVLHPQYILRERYAEHSRLHHRVPGFDLDTIEGFSPAHIFPGEATSRLSDFFRFYRSPGEPDYYPHYHRLHRARGSYGEYPEGPHGGPHARPRPGPYPGPHEGPRQGPRQGPRRGPRRGPLRSPRLPPHKGPYGGQHDGPRRRFDDREEPPRWGPPPREPGEPGDRPPPHLGPPRRGPGEPGEYPPSWPPKPPGDPDDIPRQPPDWPPEPQPEPCRPGKPCGPGGPGERLPPPPPHWPPREPKEPDHRPPHWPGEPGDRPHPPYWPPRGPGEPGKDPKHPPPRHHPWRPHPPNETIWQLISKSNRTTKFASIVSEHEDLVAVLNSTIANYTLFVPTNEAFKKFKNIPKDWKPPKDVIKKFLTYHISNGSYSIFKLLLGHTIASALDGGELGGNQRIRVALGPGGVSVNFYSHVVLGNIFATNGVIHAVDAVLFPPPAASSIIHFFPSEFSTFLLAAHLTNLTDDIPQEHTGGTLFAPPNSAFQKLGPKINAFLFSPWGRKYLKALLKYHIVVNETLYSDAYYHPTSKNDVKPQDIPRGHYHVDLPTLLENKHLSIDISRFGGLITILINAQSTVKIQDVIARDGVIQIVENVLVPPKKPPTGDSALEVEEFKNAEELENTMGMTVEQFRERFEGLVEDDGVTGEYNEEDVLNMWKR
ncbi:hypothetical protein TWF192_008828 [Orbilia oligospora]|uniref:FAS1 domain-containing protein n=1 Tax=Orbilia oligospora TaxID=2813651 RepID=A0A6G1M1C2_ORBOL|nr:hypothetical protein TWF679_010695 [Orbilia oligospora]KAF3226210.1 hypothetical protein TWF191_004871 [Orbilia oligospora]KAF3241815.1 hypothetical protein TWF192_008828 [Orbilia oligospora]